MFKIVFIVSFEFYHDILKYFFLMKYLYEKPKSIVYGLLNLFKT